MLCHLSVGDKEETKEGLSVNEHLPSAPSRPSIGSWHTHSRSVSAGDVIKKTPLWKLFVLQTRCDSICPKGHQLGLTCFINIECRA